MPSPKGDPTYIKNKERYFIEVAKTIGSASSHPLCPGGCVVVRDREILGDGRALLTDSKVEIDPVCYWCTDLHDALSILCFSVSSPHHGHTEDRCTGSRMGAVLQG